MYKFQNKKFPKKSVTEQQTYSLRDKVIHRINKDESSIGAV